MTETAQTCVAMHYLYILPYYNISEDRKEGEDRRECSLSVDYEEGDVVDFEAIGEVANTSTTFVGMGDYYHFVSSVYKFLAGFSTTDRYIPRR